MKEIYVKITKATLPAWYENDVGKTFRVKEKPTEYYGGLGYKCLDRVGGILVRDCITVEKEIR